MTTTTIPDPIRQRDAITPEIEKRLEHVRMTCFRHAKMTARAGLPIQRKELERSMIALGEIRELVQKLDQLSFESADQERQEQEAKEKQ